MTIIRKRLRRPRAAQLAPRGPLLRRNDGHFLLDGRCDPLIEGRCEKSWRKGGPACELEVRNGDRQGAAERYGAPSWPARCCSRARAGLEPRRRKTTAWPDEGSPPPGTRCARRR